MLTISWAFLLDTVKSQRAVRIHFQSLLSAVNKGWSEMWNRLTGANTSNLSAWGRLLFVLWKALGTSVPPFVWRSWWSNNSHTTRTWKETKGKKKKKKPMSPLTQRCLSRKYLGLKLKFWRPVKYFLLCFLLSPGYCCALLSGSFGPRGIWTDFCLSRVQNLMPGRARGLQSMCPWAERIVLTFIEQKSTNSPIPFLVGSPWGHRKWVKWEYLNL